MSSRAYSVRKSVSTSDRVVLELMVMVCQYFMASSRKKLWIRQSLLCSPLFFVGEGSKMIREQMFNFVEFSLMSSKVMYMG